MIRTQMIILFCTLVVMLKFISEGFVERVVFETCEVRGVSSMKGLLERDFRLLFLSPDFLLENEFFLFFFG